MIKLSIIIPSFNTKELLKACLRSIYKETQGISFEIIVVDNASNDSTVNMLKTSFPEVKLIVNQQNLGFAKANNQGLKKALGKNILLLNSDTIILDKAINKCLRFMESKENIDILGCKLLNKDKTTQPSGGYFPKLRQIFYMMFFIDDLPVLNNFLKAYQVTNKKFYQKTQQLDWVTGAFILLKKQVLDKLNGFDEKFFMYAEEVDLCFRAKKAGYKVWFFNDAKIIHLKGKSSKKGFEKSVLGEFKGLKKFYKKHKPKWELPVLRLLLKIGACLRMLIFGILRSNYKRRVYEKAFKVV
ncbi:glycosyltransferase family 2 protein [Patescibacteria group bacterium]